MAIASEPERLFFFYSPPDSLLFVLFLFILDALSKKYLHAAAAVRTNMLAIKCARACLCTGIYFRCRREREYIGIFSPCFL